MTNADRIRQMTDRELAKFLDDVGEDYLGGVLPCYPYGECTGDVNDCWECILKWLTTEAKSL